jgi:hypothetical protein
MGNNGHVALDPTGPSGHLPFAGSAKGRKMTGAHTPRYACLIVSLASICAAVPEARMVPASRR